MSTKTEEEESLKGMVHSHLAEHATDDELKAHTDNTDNSIGSQREYLKRFISERSDNPVLDVDALVVINSLERDGIAPFINTYIK